MNRNTLKIIACISMLIDHIGYIFFPEIPFFRFIGRIAMPIFAFFIGEGCLCTRDRKKYFLRVFILGIICQAVYVIESLITGSDGWGYMNILLTFSFLIVLCSAFLYAKEQGEKGQRLKGAMVCLSMPVLILAIHTFCQSSEAVIGTKIEFDYSVLGMMLPAFACVSKDKKTRLILFSLAQVYVGYNLYSGFSPMFFCSLVPLGLLALYNGQSGKRNLKYFFYLFYPVHLAVLYLIEIVIY